MENIDKNVVKSVCNLFKLDTKLLVFGVGNDSKTWYHKNKNTYFVEDNEVLIKLNKKYIPETNIIHYTYKTTSVANSQTLSDEEIRQTTIPCALLELAPFDIIIIAGPEGGSPTKPGRLLPCYWTKWLAKPGTIIYLDDCHRSLENYCIDKYFKYKQMYFFPSPSRYCKILY